MMKYVDCNNTILKVDDRVKTKGGIEYKIINLNGVCRLARYENNRIIETLNFKKYDHSTLEKINV